MKKFVCILLCVLMTLGLCACGRIDSSVKTRDIDSKIYSPGEITAAINVIKREFAMNWSGCSLTEIYYAGDEITKEYQDWEVCFGSVKTPCKLTACCILSIYNIIQK